MATVRLPFSDEASPQGALALRASLLKEHRIDVVIIVFGGSLWARISAQAYNMLSDYQRLADAIGKLTAN
jgi:isopenicillin-N epimerase